MSSPLDDSPVYPVLTLILLTRNTLTIAQMIPRTQHPAIINVSVVKFRGLLQAAPNAEVVVSKKC
jgi:hypothetical protein